jgi:cyclophilin family peptidyl-prolyl cis-trans isomerase
MCRMKKILLLGAMLLLVVGCSSGEERVIKKVNAFNETIAEKLAKADSIAVLQEYRKEKMALFKDVQGWPNDRLQRFDSRMRKETAASQEKLNEALVSFHQRLKSDPANPVVVMETSSGPVTIELFEKLAPVTVKNFLSYVDENHYDGTIFHRVMPTFMIQGGGFGPGMKKEKTTHKPIVNESFNFVGNDRGTIAMARTEEPNSATAQFFINVVDNEGLNMIRAQDRVGYAVFGKVIDGMDVADKIREVKTHTVGPHENVPVEDVMIKSIRRVEKKK